MDGTMTWEQFLQHVDEILKVSDSLADGWTLHGDRNLIGSAYLVKNMIHSSKPTAASVLEEFEEPELEECMVDNSELPKEIVIGDVAAKEEVIASSVWHVVYSVSYAVPVLYFNHRQQSGNLVNLHQVWKNADPNLQASLEMGRWQTLTQAEHPVERSPYFMLHPCGTTQLTSHASNNPVVTWLSSVCSAAGLSMNPEYGLLVSDKQTTEK